MRADRPKAQRARFADLASNGDRSMSSVARAKALSDAGEVVLTDQVLRLP